MYVCQVRGRRSHAASAPALTKKRQRAALRLGRTSVIALSARTLSGKSAKERVERDRLREERAAVALRMRMPASRNAEMSRCIKAVYRANVPLFPPGAPVTVLVDGRPLAAYARAYLIGSRVFARSARS